MGPYIICIFEICTWCTTGRALPSVTEALKHPQILSLSLCPSPICWSFLGLGGALGKPGFKTVDCVMCYVPKSGSDYEPSHSEGLRINFHRLRFCNLLRCAQVLLHIVPIEKLPSRTGFDSAISYFKANQSYTGDCLDCEWSTGCKYAILAVLMVPIWVVSISVGHHYCEQWR